MAEEAKPAKSRKPIYIVLGGALLGILASSIGYYKGRRDTHNQLYDNVSQLISTIDGERGTSQHDWAVAYSVALGRHFDVYRDNPNNDLSLEELGTIRDTAKRVAKIRVDVIDDPQEIERILNGKTTPTYQPELVEPEKLQPRKSTK